LEKSTRKFSTISCFSHTTVTVAFKLVTEMVTFFNQKPSFDDDSNLCIPQDYQNIYGMICSQTTRF
jgi:hypothetical protein